MTHLRGSGRGDIIIHAMVQTPTKLSHEQEDLLRRLATLRDEEKPTGRITNPAEGSLFGKLRDAGVVSRGSRRARCHQPR